tara:strand:- start:201 stop:509 length:309 start_codon:yes stop_codon:yes gene_type:complete
MRFDGADYVPPRDDPRLTSQHQRLRALMQDGQWRTLSEIAQETGDPEASMSAQLNDLMSEKEAQEEIKALADLIRGGNDISKMSRSEAKNLYDKMNNLPSES